MNSLERMQRRSELLEAAFRERPPWWRVLARRRWRRRLRQIMEMDVSVLAEIFARHYPAVSAKRLANRTWP